MKTERPFSTISYNTLEILQQVLDDQMQRGTIRFYAFIHHFSEYNKKSHFHVYVEPNEQIDTIQFSNLFLELANGDPAPRSWLPCQVSKLDDWYMYSVHNYSFNQVITSDQAYLRKHINCSAYPDETLED